MKKYFYLLAVASLLAVVSCQDDNSANEHSCEKTLATIDNVGEIHNYLLDQIKDSEKDVSNSKKRTMKDLIGDFQSLSNDGKYYYTESLTRVANPDLSKFDSLNVEDFDIENIRLLVLEHIASDTNISSEVKKVIEIISDPKGNPLSEENLLLIERNKEKKGGELLIVFRNIAESSSNYWANTRNAESRAVIVADAVGGVLGTTCSGVMGILWGAGFSYACDMCMQ